MNKTYPKDVNSVEEKVSFVWERGPLGTIRRVGPEGNGKVESRPFPEIDQAKVCATTECL
jgi:hypothetical protein